MSHTSDDDEKVMKNSWTPEEDALLREQIKKAGGPGNWTAIAEALKGRSSKSCRLRWCNQLNPSVKRGPFTEEEDKAILAAHDFYGNKWAIISRSIPGRTDNQVKNRFNSTLRKLASTLRRDAKAKAATVTEKSKKRKGGALEVTNGNAKKVNTAERGKPSKKRLTSRSFNSEDASYGTVVRLKTDTDDDDHGNNSGEDETVSGLEQLVQASLEVERIQNNAEGGGATDNDTVNDNDMATQQSAEASVRGAGACVDLAALYTKQVQQQLHLAAQQSALAANPFAATAAAPTAPIAPSQRYPPLQSLPSFVTAKQEQQSTGSDSTQSSAGNFTMPGMVGNASAINSLALQLLLQQQPQMNLLLQQLMVEQAIANAKAASPMAGVPAPVTIPSAPARDSKVMEGVGAGMVDGVPVPWLAMMQGSGKFGAFPETGAGAWGPMGMFFAMQRAQTEAAAAAAASGVLVEQKDR